MGKKIVWATDVHFDHAHHEKKMAFLRRIEGEKPDFLFLTGDNSSGNLLEAHIRLFELHLPEVQTFFVLGNHDFYNGSIADVRNLMLKSYSSVGPGKATYAISKPFFAISESTALVGHDGWYDGLYANWFSSQVDMCDYYIIQELNNNSCPVREMRYNFIQKLARQAADHINLGVNAAINSGFKNIYIITHIPPFRENAVYEGKISDDDWMPHFSSAIMGDELIQLAAENINVEFTVLCGHSHGQATHRELPNLVCHTGKARYKVPAIADIFKVK